jgi:hypothetical protein
MIEVCTWKSGAQAPVIFMIDDLANIYVQKSLHCGLAYGEDWGAGCFIEGGLWDFLNNCLLKDFPQVKMTFFLVLGRRAAMTCSGQYTFCAPIDSNPEFGKFLQFIHRETHHELAYHGVTHGVPGNRIEDFTQEWDTFVSLDQAMETILSGRDLFQKVIGEYPSGGKFCGYASGKFGLESVQRTGFEWWFPSWNEHLSDMSEIKYYKDLLLLPSNIDGSHLTLKGNAISPSKKYAKAIINALRSNSIEQRITNLINNRCIISIQEHSSPLRTDNRIQYPNVVYDMHNLQYIFSLLSTYDVWYATASEVSNYIRLRSSVNIYAKTNRTFTFIETGNQLRLNDMRLTVDLGGIECSAVQVGKFVLPVYRKGEEQYVDVPVILNEEYTIV